MMHGDKRASIEWGGGGGYIGEGMEDAQGDGTGCRSEEVEGVGV